MRLFEFRSLSGEIDFSKIFPFLLIDGAVTPNEDSTDDDDSDDDDDDDNDDEAEVRFEFPGNTGWPAFSDSD